MRVSPRAARAICGSERRELSSADARSDHDSGHAFSWGGRVMAASGREIVVEKLIPDGKALGRLADGRVVILSGAVPGDRVELGAVAESKGLVTAHSFRLLEPSSLRVAPSCGVAHRCGGCDWMVLPIDEQRRQKREILKEALWRTGKIDWRERPLELVTGARHEAYRCRVRLQVAGGRVGFFERGSHELVEPDVCRVSSERVNAALGQLRRVAREHAEALGVFAWVEVREAGDGTVSVLLEPRAPLPRRQPESQKALLLALEQEFVVGFGGQAPSQHAGQRFDLTDDTFMLSALQGFVQVNWEVNRLLVARVIEGAAARGVTTFLDAYAGSGNFSLPLLRRGLRGLAVESNPSAVGSAREAARLQGLDPEAFVVGDAARFAAARAERGERFDLVFCDPPRAGLKTGLEPLARAAARWLAICSCNPVTLARDLSRLVALGFELETIVAFDMFPQTHHLETLAWLRAPAELSP
jgi:23S rRNA (uracil1939-C5)-methyltransferase